MQRQRWVLGIVISKRQIVRLLIAGQHGFLNEARDVLRAGLSNSAWITVEQNPVSRITDSGY